MEKVKRVNPYVALLEEIKAFCLKVKYPHTAAMFCYPRAKLGEGWSLTDLYERAKAADQLGYDVVMVPKDDGLHVRYVKRPQIPLGWS